MQAGIYKIENVCNGHIYIGSSKDIEARWHRHKLDLMANRHHNPYLQRAWNKYGDNAFVFIVLEHLNDVSLLYEYEQIWIDKLSPQYNIGSVGGGDCISNHPNYEQICQQQSNIQKTKINKLSDKERAAKYGRLGNKNPNWKGGKSLFTCPCCMRIIKRTNDNQKSCKQCMPSLSGKQNPFYGKKHSVDTKNKIGVANKGRKPTNSRSIRINNVLYTSYADAAKAIGCSSSMISWRVKKGIYTANGPNWIDS